MNSFFNAKINEVGHKHLAIHLNGFKEKLDMELMDEHHNNICQGDYKDIPYLEIIKIRDITTRNLIRLDQIPLFQKKLDEFPYDT